MSNPITALFGPSPIRPIQKHMAKAQGCITLLGDFLEASLTKDWAKAEEVQKAIHQAENEADSLKREIRTHLPRSLWLPVARSDLLEMLQFQDRLANRAREIAGIMLGRKIEIPEELVESVRDYYQINLNTSAQALKAINELDGLLETGFRGREANLVEELLAELDELEHQSDVSQVKLRAMLFQMEDSLPPVNVIFLYRVIDRLGELADISQKVGGRLLLLIAK
ncbi:MAG: TIGR00153 family protein [Gammaproteobacteria bacterium]|nr:TIGR00153 family protein [Gammaproteobacteria bacterium]